MERLPAPLYLREGEVVAEGSDPIHCAMPHATRQGWTCRGFVGLPEPGAVLLKVFEAGEYIGTSQRGLWAWRCEKCRRAYIFRAPGVVPVK
jgi:hypothetical protein